MTVKNPIWPSLIGLTAFLFLTISINILETSGVTSPSVNSPSLILNSSFIQSKIARRYHPSQNIKNPRVYLKLAGESGMLSTQTQYSYFTSTLPTTIPPTKYTTTAKTDHYLFSPTPNSNSKLFSFTDKYLSNTKKPVFAYNTHDDTDKSKNSQESGQTSSASLEEIENAQKLKQDDYYSTESGELSDEVEELTPQQTQQHGPIPLYRHQNNLWSPPTSETTQNLLVSTSDLTLKEQKEVKIPYEQYDNSPTTAIIKPTASSVAERRVDDIDRDLNDLLNLNPSLYPFTLNDFENGAVADDDQISRYFIKTRPRERDGLQSQGRTTLSVSVSPIIDFTSSPPVTISSLNMKNVPYSNSDGSTYLQSVTESSDSWQSQNGERKDENYPMFSTPSIKSTKSPPLILAESQQQQSKVEGLFNYDSSLPPTSTNSLPHDQDHVKDFTLPPPTPSPLTTSTDATSIPGMPGIDYPILGEVPYTGFDCQKQRYKGFFADVHTKCQAWHYCDFTDGHSTFLCPNGTLFSQVLLTCDWWFNVDCSQAQQLYVLNERLYRYIKPPKPSFPEDFHGPQVDLWLVQQLQLGLLPKMKKKVKDKIVIMGSH